MKVRAYYGSTVKFDEWDITKTREFGYHFGIEDELQSLRRIRDGGYIYDVELTFNNPLRMKDALRWELRSITDVLGLPYDDFEKEARLRARRNYSTLGEERNLIAAEILDQHGYDAILYDNMGETGGKAIIVWNPAQIHVLRVSRVTKDPAGRGLGLRQQTESSLRSLIREMCKKTEYWGRGGAGIMFRCPEDDTILLLLRADWVDQGGTWGIPGGGVEEGWFETPIEDPITDHAVYQKAAFREAVEECGSLPPGFSSSQVTASTVYEDCGFQYVTLIADITLEQKQGWRLVSNDGETDDFQWIPRKKLRSGVSVMGRRLHFGVEYTLSRM